MNQNTFTKALYAGLMAILLVHYCTTIVSAQQSQIVTLENVPGAKKIVADEAYRQEFSAVKAARYLDAASLNWQKRQNCVTCHTNMSYLMARPALNSAMEGSGEVRDFFESYYKQRWEMGKKPPGNAYDPVVVGTALVFNDMQTSGKMADVTRKTLDTMWETQREDGGWAWAKCGWAPMEIDDHYGVTLAALAVGIAPDDYVNTAAALEGMNKAKSFLLNNPPPSLHHRIMICWASIRIDGLMDKNERAEVLDEIFAKQLPGGGWSTPGFLSDWKEFERKDDKPHDTSIPDAYGTGLAIVVARELGIPVTDKRLQSGISWLKSNQKASGKWYTRSPSKDSRHYFTNFGCAFAVLALQSCDELPGWPLENQNSN